MPSNANSRHASDLTNSPGIIGAAARFYQRSYAADYIALAILSTGYILIVLFVEPFHRMFYLDNLAISFPHAEHERVSVTYLLLYALALPLTLLTLWTFFSSPPLTKSHPTLLGLLTSLILTLFLTDLVKNAVGRPRPDLLARCKPEPGTPAHTLVNFTVCTEKNHHVLHDGWRSFPSGHASFGFAGLGYLSLVIAGQWRVVRPRADLARVLVALAPLVGAVLIAISRCEDYRHDVWDVSVGAGLGMGVAYAMYRRYFPALAGEGCGEVYGGWEEGGFRKVGDEEEGGYEMGGLEGR